MVIAGELSAEAIKERARGLLRDVGLGHRFDHLPSQLSGGEQQRVTIARALANDPEILLLDEPTGDLDTRNTHLVMSILLGLNRSKGLTMVMVTHDVYMKQYANRVLYLRDGKVHRVEAIDPIVTESAYRDLQKTVATEQERVRQPVSELPTTEFRNARCYPCWKPDQANCKRNQEVSLLDEVLFGQKSRYLPPYVVPNS
jgi:putative ABC transport system ATP-binding protein